LRARLQKAILPKSSKFKKGFCMKKSFLVVFLAISSLLNADVSISSASFQEKKVGKETKWVKATRVVPGTKVRYVNSLTNSGAQNATNLVITNITKWSNA
jgi:hypothetical protein